MNKNQQFTYIDLFAGAGGLSEGFIREDFVPIASVEMEEKACLTLKTRIAFHHLHKQKKDYIYDSYLRNEISSEELYSYVPDEEINTVINESISEETIQKIFKKIDKNLNKEKVDLIIGGPPCQAYSVIGRASDPFKMTKDPRNHLYKHYLEFLVKYKPKVFVFENVKGLLSAGKNQKYLNLMFEGFTDAGYKADYKILNAADFGVLQHRERIIIVGWKKDLNISYPDFPMEEKNAKIKNILSDLPSIEPGINQIICKYTKSIPDEHYLRDKKIRNGRDFVTQHKTRPVNERDAEIYGIAVEKLLEKGERLRYYQLPKRLKTHLNETDFMDRFKVVDLNGLSHTVVAHLAKDGHHYIYPSYEQIRSISIREAARIQSFPDDFFFEGGQGAAFRQIGNAVPPLMAEVIAREIRKMLLKNN